VRIVSDVQHSAVGVVVAETRIQPTQSHHVVEADTGTCEQPTEHLGQGQHAGAGLNLHPVQHDGAGLAARPRPGLEYPHAHSAGSQRKCGGQSADTGADHQHIGTTLN